MQKTVWVALLVLLFQASCTSPAEHASRPACRMQVAEDPAGEPTVQVFALGFKQDVTRMRTYEDYTALMEEAIAEAAPCFSTRIPNLVVFPENTALIAAFIGNRGEQARERNNAVLAFADLLTAYGEPISHYKTAYPDAPGLRQLLLALTDTLARAIERTFPPMARKHGVYLAIDVDVADYQMIADDALAKKLRDPDLPGGEPAYEATSAEVYNVSIVYGPDGNEIGRVRKAYLTPPEEDQLSLSYGSLEQLKPIVTPFGTLAPVISKDGWMPDVMERFNDLGAEITLQHEAFSGWAIDERGGDWLPDVMLESIWWQTQAFDSIRYAVLPCITGNLLDMVFDCQSAITKEADAADSAMAFIGQEPRPGFLSIGPWAMPDPIEEEPGLPLDARRKRLRERGNAMQPGSGSPDENSYVASSAAGALTLGEENGLARRKPADSQPPPSTTATPLSGSQEANAIRPDAASSGETSHIVWIDVQPGERAIGYTQLDTSGVGQHTKLPIQGTYLYGARVTAAGEDVYVIAVDEAAAGARLTGALSRDRGVTWQAWSPPLGPAEGARWQPAIAASAESVYLTWVDRRSGASDIYFAASHDRGESFSVQRLDEPHAEESVRDNPANPRNNQALPAIAVYGNAVAIIWADFRNYHWDVYGAVSNNAGTSWSPNYRLNPEVPDTKERIFGANDIAISASRMAVVAEGVDDRGADRFVHTFAPTEFCALLGRTCLPARKSERPGYRPQAEFTHHGFSLVYQSAGAIWFESEAGNYAIDAGGMRFNPRLTAHGWVWEDWATGLGQILSLSPTAASQQPHLDP